MEPVLVRLVCQNCGYRAAPGMGMCLRCDTLNPDYEIVSTILVAEGNGEDTEEEDDGADRDLGTST